MANERASLGVLAAAPGRVLRTRDDIPDVSVSVPGRNDLVMLQPGSSAVYETVR